jgi:hypothetical protein
MGEDERSGNVKTVARACCKLHRQSCCNFDPLAKQRKSVTSTTTQQIQLARDLPRQIRFMKLPQSLVRHVYLLFQLLGI